MCTSRTFKSASKEEEDCAVPIPIKQEAAWCWTRFCLVFDTNFSVFFWKEGRIPDRSVDMIVCHDVPWLSRILREQRSISSVKR